MHETLEVQADLRSFCGNYGIQVAGKKKKDMPKMVNNYWQLPEVNISVDILH